MLGLLGLWGSFFHFFICDLRVDPGVDIGSCVGVDPGVSEDLGRDLGVGVIMIPIFF